MNRTVGQAPDGQGKENVEINFILERFMNRVYQLVWSEKQGQYVVASEKSNNQGRKGGGVRAGMVGALLAGLLGSMNALAIDADALPAGGILSAGAATFARSGSTLHIDQSSERAAINWQSFSVGANATVNFNQPNASAVTLNRVVGNESSVIAGALNANGQVFVLNSNGVLFAQGAQVNVGGIVASTLGMSDADFMAGKATFTNNGTRASVINMGTITTADGGYAALIGNQVKNQGVVVARLGTAAFAAGDKVSLNFNGNSLVGVAIEQGTFNALVENGHAIRADGGLVVLTAKGIDAVLGSVVNNTGEVRAQTVANKDGKIFLLGGMEHGTVNAAGTLDASAPSGGNGGFIETSAASVKLDGSLSVRAGAVAGQSGQWLIDPTDYTISAAEAATIQTSLNGGTDVTIATSSTNTGSERGDITLDTGANIAWNRSTLVLRAHNDIWIKGNLTGTGSAKLGLEYGQSTSGDSGNITSYTVLGSLSLPDNSFYAKFGTGGSTSWTNVPLFLNNGLLRFGNGSQNSVDEHGSLRQPFYYNSTDKRWYKLTYSDSPMFLNLGFGGTGYSDGTIITNQTSSGGLWTAVDSNDGNAYFLDSVIGSVNFANGIGTLTTSNTVDHGGSTLLVQNSYTLRPNKAVLEAQTTVTNTGTSSAANVRLWTGTRDDFIGLDDQNYKQKGNITVNGFEAVSAGSSNAVKVYNNSEGVIFFSTKTGAETTVGYCCMPNFHTDYDANWNSILLSSPQQTPYNAFTDGNYSIYSNLGNLAAGQNGAVAWFYGAGRLTDLGAVAESIGRSATGNAPSPGPSEGVLAAVRNTVAPQREMFAPRLGDRIDTTATGRIFNNVVTVPAEIQSGFGPGTRLALISSPRSDEPTQVVSISQASAMLSSADSSDTVSDGEREVRVPASRGSLVDIVNGGVKLPSGVEQQLFVVKSN